MVVYVVSMKEQKLEQATRRHTSLITPLSAKHMYGTCMVAVGYGCDGPIVIYSQVPPRQGATRAEVGAAPKQPSSPTRGEPSPDFETEQRRPSEATAEITLHQPSNIKHQASNKHIS